MTIIKDYELKEALSSKNAGFCRWGFCEKDGREYFIKEFLSPVYPEDSADLSPKTVERKQKLCEEFYASKYEFYSAVNSCRTGNIVTIREFFRYGPKYYAVTEKMESGKITLEDISKRSDEVKITLIRAILFSISALHKAGVIHADIKPDNILLKRTVGDFYTAKIIDFDSGFLLGKTPQEVQGDFVYLAPETYLKVRDGEGELTGKIDIFALGVLFHQYWTGELPEINSDYRYVFEAVLDGSEPKLAGSIPLGIREMISRMLSADPEKRPEAEDILEFFRKTDPADSSLSEGHAADEANTDHRVYDDQTNNEEGFFIPRNLG
ncbi:MAG: protein kinase [Lachnospiraceae bacterium]|nr:protein kinase [Lachnospiraceae bacterium]